MLKIQSLSGFTVFTVVATLVFLGTGCGGDVRVPGNNPQQGAQPGKNPNNPQSSPSPTATPVANPSGKPSAPPAPLPPFEQPEIYFIPGGGSTGEVALYPAWPNSLEDLKPSDYNPGGVPARINQEIRFERVIQIPRAEQPQLFVVIKDQLEGSPVTSINYSAHYYDSGDRRYGAPSSQAVSYSQKHHLYFLPLQSVIAQLKEHVGAGDARERYELVFDIDLQHKGTRQWTIHFSVNPPLPEIPVKHVPYTSITGDFLRTGSIPLYETQILNAYGRKLNAWAYVSIGHIGYVETGGTIDRYPESATTPNPGVIRVDALRSEAWLYMDTVEVLTAPANSPYSLQTQGIFKVKDRNFNYPLAPATLTVFRWKGMFTPNVCPAPNRLNRQFRWATDPRCGTAPIPPGVDCTPRQFATFSEVFQPKGYKVQANMAFALRVTDAHWKKDVDVFGEREEVHPNLRIAPVTALPFVVSTLAPGFALPAQSSCTGIF